MIERHLQNAELHHQEARVLQTTCSERETQIGRLKQALDDTTKDRDVEKQVHQEAAEGWRKRVGITVKIN